MKHIFLAVMAAALIFMATAGYSRGFSVGVFGAYSIDGGNIEDSIKEKRYQEYYFYTPGNYSATKSEYDTIVIPGAGFFASYEFNNGFFIRAGVERYELVSGGEVSKTLADMGSMVLFDYDYTIEYNATAAPVLIGLNLSPDKGRTSFYFAMGVIVSMTEVYRETSYPAYNYTSENDTIITGFAGILGVEKRIINHLYIIAEYAFYKCEKDMKQSGEANVYPYEYEYTENYGLPRQQARIGVKYSF